MSRLRSNTLIILSLKQQTLIAITEAAVGVGPKK